MKTSGERLKELLESRRTPFVAFANEIGVSTQVLNNWFARGVPGGQILKVSAALQVDPAWLQDGSEPIDVAAPERPTIDHPGLLPISVWDDDTPLDDDEVEVPFLKELELAAGSGRTVIQQSSTSKLRFGKYTLRNHSVQFDQAVCVTVHGNSMEPVLPHNSTVAVNQADTRIVDGKIYALNHDGQLRVKLLYRLPGGGMRMRSFNRDEHEDEDFTADQQREKHISVIGRVFWGASFF